MPENQRFGSQIEILDPDILLLDHVKNWPILHPEEQSHLSKEILNNPFATPHLSFVNLSDSINICLGSSVVNSRLPTNFCFKLFVSPKLIPNAVIQLIIQRLQLPSNYNEQQYILSGVKSNGLSSQAGMTFTLSSQYKRDYC